MVLCYYNLIDRSSLNRLLLDRHGERSPIKTKNPSYGVVLIGRIGKLVRGLRPHPCGGLFVYKKMKTNQELQENIDYIKKLTLGKGSWGTNLDNKSVKSIPPTYVGVSFVEMNHSELKKFFMLTDIEKFEMAYWAERYNSRRSGIYGLLVGLSLGILLLILI